MYCRSCGSQIDQEDLFCPKCGTRAVKIVTNSPMFKNPGLAAVISTIIPGLGQIYNGHIPKGIIFLLIGLGALVLAVLMRMPEKIGVVILYLIIWTISIFDAYKVAEKINLKIDSIEEKK